MTHLEFKQQHPRASGKVSIIGTDICDTVLAAAKEGEYSELSMARGLSVERMATFFSRLGGSHYRINNEVKSLVNFQSINLLQSYAHLGKFDIVFCRNVLIYFSPAVKKKILQQIASLLPPDGILFVGASESISSMTDLFVMQRSTHEIYYKKKD
jgi:chemotaxis protein methyltransferase CheR